MARTHGSGRRRASSPSRSGFSRVSGSLDLVATKLVPECCSYLRCERFLLARREARVQRRGDDRERDGVLDRLLDRPAALAGVVDVAADLREVRVFSERAGEEVEQPAADDGAVAPEL